jgi:hypothetical protein
VLTHAWRAGARRRFDNDVRKSRQPVDETLKILEDPNSKFSAVPDGTMR